MAQIIFVAGYTGPDFSYGSKDLDFPFSCFLQSYKTYYPSPNPQLALTILVLRCVADFYRTKQTPVASAVTYILTIVLFFLLRPVKYAMTLSRSRTFIVQFRQQDACFLKNCTVLPHATPLGELQKTDGVRLYLDNQENGQQGITMYHSALNQDFFLVKSLVNSTHYMYSIVPKDSSLPISCVVATADITLPFW